MQSNIKRKIHKKEKEMIMYVQAGHGKISIYLSEIYTPIIFSIIYYILRKKYAKYNLWAQSNG